MSFEKTPAMEAQLISLRVAFDEITLDGGTARLVDAVGKTVELASTIQDDSQRRDFLSSVGFHTNTEMDLAQLKDLFAEEQSLVLSMRDGRNITSAEQLLLISDLDLDAVLATAIAYIEDKKVVTAESVSTSINNVLRLAGITSAFGVRQIVANQIMSEWQGEA